MKTVLTLTCFLIVPLAATAQSVSFGNDSSEWANDGECDDRRFVGQGMASYLDWDDTKRDATDCKRAYDLGMIRLWDQTAARAATQCSAINFGDDSSQYSRDGECDDPRFEGPGTDSIMGTDDLGGDATDCRAQCEIGRVFLRNY